MATYAVKSEPFDNSDGEWPSMGICVNYNGRSLEIHVIDTDETDTYEPSDACVGLTNFIYSKMIGQGF